MENICFRVVISGCREPILTDRHNYAAADLSLGDNFLIYYFQESNHFRNAAEHAMGAPERSNFLPFLKHFY